MLFYIPFEMFFFSIFWLSCISQCHEFQAINWLHSSYQTHTTIWIDMKLFIFECSSLFHIDLFLFFTSHRKCGNVWKYTRGIPKRWIKNSTKYRWIWKIPFQLFTIAILQRIALDTACISASCQTIDQWFHMRALSSLQSQAYDNE